MADDNVMRFSVNGESYELDPEDLTLDELGEIEDFMGRSYHSVDFESARGLQTLAWVAIRRKQPDFSLADAGAIKITAFSAEEEKPRPTKAKAAKLKAA